LRVLIGGERFGISREAWRARGHNAYSCDIVPAIDGSPYHLQCDVRTVFRLGWDIAIFHPDCTYLTSSAEWAYADPNFERYPGVGYHQRVKPQTLVGEARRAARKEAVSFVFECRDAPIPLIVIENPRGHLSTAWRPPNQTIQPNEYGDDASKATCLWIEGELPLLVPTKLVPPRFVNGRPRWANQTDGGQNRLSPSDDRAMARAATYPGIANAMADQWGRKNASVLPLFSQLF
jgi:hypothetical protein